MPEKWKQQSDSAIQLAESCCSDILSDIQGFKKPVEEQAGMEKKEHGILQAEGTPLEIQNKQEGQKKEESVTIEGRKEEEHLIQVEPEPDAPPIQGVAAQSSFNDSGPMADSESGIMSNSVLEEQAGMEKKEHGILQAEGTPLEIQNKQEGKKKEESVTIQGRKEEEHLIQVEPEPDAPPIQGLAAQSSFNDSGPMADSESGIMSNSVLIILGVAGVIIGLDLYFRA